MPSKFQERLLSHAFTYFTETNLSLRTGQSAVGSAWNLATNFLWQQFQHTQNLYTGRNTSSAIYSHHGPDGLERACELLKHFKVLSEDNMNALKSALSYSGEQRKTLVRLALQGNTDNENEEDEDQTLTIITLRKKREPEDSEELPYFTQDDANHLLAFISNDADVLDSTFGQSVFLTAFSLLGVFSSDIERTQQTLNSKAQEQRSSSSFPIKHAFRADCHILYQKIMPWQTANASMHQSVSANRSPSTHASNLF